MRPQHINGMQIVVSENALEATEERLFPESRNRSRRIRKKLIKRFGGEFRKVPAIFRIGNQLVMHPDRYRELQDRLREEGRPQ